MSDQPVENLTGEESDPNATRQAAPMGVRRKTIGQDDSKLGSESDISGAGRLGPPDALARVRSVLELAPGATIGDYEIVRLLGEGGVARVYLARQRSLDRLVALKVSDTAQFGGFRTSMSIHTMLSKIPARHRGTHAVRVLLAKISSSPAPAPVPAVPPGDWDAFDLYLTGVLQAKERRDEPARLYFKAAADRCVDTGRPLKFWAHFQLADCLFRLQEFDRAAVEYGACTGLRGKFAWPYNNLGLVYQRQGKLAEAARQFEEAIMREPKLGPAYTNLSAIQIELNQFAKAETTCTTAIQMGYRTADIFSNRGVARAALGNRAGAIQDLRAALDIDPKFDKARENLRLLNPDSRR